MIRKIILHNFMSHAHTVIEPAHGLTVLVGENNCGKSAIVEALQILCQNASGDWMVRHGENECRVLVETDEGHVVEWKRINGTVSYSLDDKPIHRLRGGIPEELHDLLRMPQVPAQDGGAPFDIHFGEQKKPVFLLDEPGSRAAKFFASSSDAETLIKMQILHRNNVRDATKNSDRLLNELREVGSDLEPLENIPHIQARLDSLENQYQNLTTNCRIARALELALKRLSDGVDQDFWLADKARAFRGIQAPPIARDTISLGGLVSNLDGWAKQFFRFCEEQRILVDLQVPPKLPDSEKLEALTSRMTRLSQEVDHISESLVTLSTLGTPPKLPDVEKLETFTCHMTQLGQEVDYVSKMAETLSALCIPPKPTPTQNLETTIEGIDAAINEVHYRRNRAQGFADLYSPPRLFNLQPLSELIGQYDSLTAKASRSQEQVKAFQNIKAPPSLVDELGFVDLVRMFDWCEADVAKRSVVCRILATLTYPPELADPSPLGSLISRIEVASENFCDRQRGVKQATSESAKAEAALRAFVTENRICPTCGAELDPNRLVSQADTGLMGHSHD